MTGRASAVQAMLEARTVAIVGASARTGTFGHRLVTEVTRSPGNPQVYLVNPHHTEIGGRPCVPTLADVPAPVDLVLLGVGDHALEPLLETAAGRGDRSAVVFGNAYEPPHDGRAPLRERLAAVAAGAGMALCGASCMGFVNPAVGLRAIGYQERDDLPCGDVALVSHSGSAFSALLRSRRRFGFSLAVSSGQELVTTTADYLDYALDRPETRAVALLLETIREPERLRASLARAAERDVPVVLLAVGGTPTGKAMVSAHTGALAGDHATWEALSEAYGLLRVSDLDEMADVLELTSTGRRATGAPGTTGRGLGTVHDSGAERTLVADLASEHGVPLADLSPSTLARLGDLLDPGLHPGNPLDVWGNGADTQALFTACLQAMADDPAVAAVAFGVDLVPEYDGDDSFPLTILDVAASTSKPVVVLANMVSSIDQEWAHRLREHGVPVLEGTRSGLLALGHLMRLGQHRTAAPPAVQPDVPTERADRWRRRLSAGPLGGAESFALLADYGVPATEVEAVRDAEEAVAAAGRLGWPVVLKTDEPGVAHKSDVGGVLLGLRDADAVRAAYSDLRTRLGPRGLVAATAPPGVEIVAGVHRDPLLGPLVVVGAGGVFTEVLDDRAVALPPLTEERAWAMLDRLRARRLLDGWRGDPAADAAALVRAVCAIGQLASELGEHIDGLDVNPLVTHPGAVVAVDVLIVPRRNG